MFQNEAQAERARLFHRLTTGTMVVATVILLVIVVVQPAQYLRAGIATAVVNVLGFLLLAVNRRGHTRAASISLIAGLVLLVSIFSLTAGGIHSPGVTMFFVFVLMAGLLLGQRAGLMTAGVCAAVGLTLTLLTSAGLTRQLAVPYSDLTFWLLNCLYMGVVLILLRLATDVMAKALSRAESEISVRRRTEVEREQLVHDLGERVKELRLLHAVARVLQSTRPFDRSVLEEVVAMLPAAWRHPAKCEARITYGTLAASTPEWRETAWQLSAAFTTSDGTGSVAVAYRQPPADATDDPFLPEERTLMQSVAEMLAAYLEHGIAEQRRVQLESQLRRSQQMEALGTLAGGIAHDFNNLLAAIGSNADLALTDPSAAPAVREHLTELRKAHGRASDLVKRILLFSRRQESDRQAIAVAPIVEEAVQLLRASLPATIDIRFHAAPDLPPVLADGSQIHQVVMNLGTNAGSAMAARGGVLDVTLDTVTIGASVAAPSAELDQGPHVRLVVRDSGAGMTPEIRAHLFEPFFTTKGTAGTGLGLSVVHGIVSDHGGAITVASEPGRGATFTVYLPATHTHAVGASPAVDVMHGHGEHLMYVDDEEALVFVMTRLLKRLGYACSGFSDADAALQAFRTDPHAFAAVITDMTMPRMTGAVLAKEIRAVRPDVPVAIVSGFQGAESEAAAAGITRIPKPVTIEVLSQTLRTLLTQGR